MIKVLFICIQNSARSQMAEAFLNRLGDGLFFAESAGLEASVINPMVIKAMAEIGYDLSGKGTHSVFDYFEEGRKYDIVVKVCDRANSERCPIFPSAKRSLLWSFPDPAAFEGTIDEKIIMIREIRDQIKRKVEELIETFEIKS